MDLLETPRLLLRPFAAGDAVLVHRVYSDPEVMRYVATGPMATSRSPSGCSADYAAHQRRHGYSFWAVIERSSGTLIGDAGLYRTPAGEIELGYTLGGLVGPGLRTEAPALAQRRRGAAAGEVSRWPSRPHRLAARARQLGMRRAGERIASGARTRCCSRSSSASIPSGRLEADRGARAA